MPWAICPPTMHPVTGFMRFIEPLVPGSIVALTVGSLVVFAKANVETGSNVFELPHTRKLLGFVVDAAHVWGTRRERCRASANDLGRFSATAGIPAVMPVSHPAVSGLPQRRHRHCPDALAKWKRLGSRVENQSRLKPVAGSLGKVAKTLDDHCAEHPRSAPRRGHIAVASFPTCH